MLDKYNKLPLSYQIEQIICYWIITGKYAIGDFLPSQLELEKYFKVSRITIRGAITNLIVQGILKSFQGKGTCVENMPSSTIYNTQPSKHHSTSSNISTMQCNIIDVQYNLTNSQNTSCPISEWNSFHLIQGIRKKEDKAVIWEDTYANAEVFSKNHNYVQIKYSDPYHIDLELNISHYQESFFYQPCTEFLSKKLGVQVGSPLLGIKRLCFCQDNLIPIECRLSYLKHEDYEIFTSYLE